MTPLLLAVALASSADPRGWTRGTVAADAPKVLANVPEFPVLPFPKALVDGVTGPVVLFYFSPTCPHCRHVAPEIQHLSTRLAGAATVIGVASGGAEEADLAEFRATYSVTFPVVVDTDREIQAAMQVKSTPSAMLVLPSKQKGRLEVHDLWYPYLPGWDALVEGRVRGDMWAAFRPGEYLGSATCGVCHGEEHASWRLTPHSVAWRTLVQRGETQNPECVGCHVTGKGRPTGWGDTVTALEDVGCEACHGPGGPHDGARLDARTACEGCHDAKHSIAFTLEKGLPLVDHFRANALSEAEERELERALFAGELPQELLAFPEGANVGSARCRECHAAEHDWWSEHAHANGMASLKAEEARDPECVRCHATAKRAGRPATKLEEFDTLGGVGCESCHGPGEKHVASLSAADIQGLGDSCPVCVIEAVCTSCHTPKWSPGFDLGAALRAIDHGPTQRTP